MNFTSKIIGFFFNWLEPQQKEIKMAKMIDKEVIQQKELTWSIKKLKIAINEYSLKIKTLKKAIRQPNVNITWQQHSELTSLKWTATMLCAIRASFRKKVHLHGMTLEEQQAWLDENGMEDYKELYCR